MRKDAVPDLAAVRDELDRWRASRSPRQPIRVLAAAVRDTRDPTFGGPA